MRIVVLMAVLTALPLFAAAQTASDKCGFFVVHPENEALVFDRSGNIKRKVGPGLHSCVPFLETASIENTFSTRNEEVESSWFDGGCIVKISVYWRISDLEKFHIIGREAVVVPRVRKAALNALDYAEARFAKISFIEFAEISEFEIRAIPQRIDAALRQEAPAFEELGVWFRSGAGIEICAQQ